MSFEPLNLTSSTLSLEILCRMAYFFNTFLVPSIQKERLKIRRMPYCAGGDPGIKSGTGFKTPYRPPPAE